MQMASWKQWGRAGLTAVILAVAGVLVLLRGAGRDAEVPLKAQLIYGDQNTVLDLPLDVDRTYDVDTG